MARKKRQKTDEAPGFSGNEDRPRLTPVDVQQHVFRLAFRGYNERDVDEFLDQVTEDLAALHEENKRLREQLEEGGAGPSTAAAQRQAEAIVRQAREHAARLTASAGGGGGVPSTFVLEERRFLQKIASLVQGHAGWLKEEARRARETALPASEPVAEPEPVAAPEPVEVAAETPAPAPRTSVDEPTAAWTPEPSDLSDEKDPLVSAWESAWAPDEPPRSSAKAGQKRAQKGEEGEPSLRELFWGEE
ncbi:MAG TPA: DivIVA domain-containing protein [Actinomycetota bacterium]|nr:DivIVA domain-containing protein [Actinomycetota bacterium]